MALSADLDIGPLPEKRRLVVDLGELIAVGRLVHDGMTVRAGEAATRMRARLPIGVHPLLMALQAGAVLHLPGFGVFAKTDQTADALAAAAGDVIAAGPVARLARLFFAQGPGIEEKDFAHLRLRKLLELRRMTGFADVAADINRLRRRRIGGENNSREGDEENRGRR